MLSVDSLRQYKEQYIKKLNSDRKSSLTIDNYNYNLNKMINYIKDRYDGNKFEIKIAILDYIDNLNEEYEIATINTIRSTIRSFVSFMKERDYINENFGASISFLKNDTKAKEVLEPKEIEKVFEILVSELKDAERYNIFFKIRNLTLFTCFLYTGIRRFEAVKIKWNDIDFINNKITVLGKGNKTRMIPLLPDLKQQLYSYRDILEQMSMKGYNVKSEYLFRSEKRNKITKKKDVPMTGKNAEVIIKDIINKAGIKKNITPRSIRHTFASYGIKNRINLPSLSNILGHSKKSTTLNIYVHEISIEEKKKEMEKIKFDI